MKNVIIPAFTIVTMMMSCSNNSIVSKSEEYLKKELLDKNSYELIESSIDTIHKSAHLKIQAESDSTIAHLYLNQTTEQIELARIWLGSYSGYGHYKYQTYRDAAKQYNDSATVYVKKYKSKLNEYLKLVNTSKDSITGFDVKLRYYATSRDGKRRIGDATIHTEKDGTPYGNISDEPTVL